MKAPRIDVLVLAAGRSLRAGGPNKLLLPWQGKAVVVHGVDAALGSRAESVHVVTGHDQASLHEALHAAGVAELAPDLDGMVLCLGDMPWVRSQQINRLIDGFDPNAVRVATFGNRRGHPVLFPRAWFGELMQLAGDDLARCLFDGLASSVVEVPMSDDAVLRDVDHREDLSDSEALRISA